MYPCEGWKRPFTLIERNAHMHEPDLWTDYAEAMRMSLEGNRVIARELAGLAGNIWRKATHAFEGLLHGLGQH